MTEKHGDALFYSHTEVRAAALACGMTETEVNEVVEKFADVGDTGVLTKDQFDAIFADEDIPFKIPFERSTWWGVLNIPFYSFAMHNLLNAARVHRYEGLFALVVSPRCESGKYFLKNGIKGDVNEPWGRYFNAFTPNHSTYYFVGILRNFFVIAGLNFLKFYPAFQAGFVTLVEGLSIYSILRNAPYVNLAQSRTDLVGAAQRFLVFAMASLPFYPTIPLPGGRWLELAVPAEKVELVAW